MQKAPISDYQQLKDRLLNKTGQTSVNALNTILNWPSGKLNHLLSGRRNISIEDLMEISFLLKLDMRVLVHGLFWGKLLQDPYISSSLDAIENPYSLSESEHYKAIIEQKESENIRLTNAYKESQNEVQFLKQRIRNLEIEKNAVQLENQKLTFLTEREHQHVLRLRAKLQAVQIKYAFLEHTIDEIKRGGNTKAIVSAAAAFFGGLLIGNENEQTNY